LHDVAVLAAQLEVVEDPDERAEDASDRRLLAHLGRGLDPSARVDVLGLIALELLGELGDLALELGDPSGVGRGGGVAGVGRGGGVAIAGVGRGGGVAIAGGGLLEELRRLRVDRVHGLLGALALGGGGAPGGADRAVLRVHLPLVGEGEPRLTLRALRVVGVAGVLGHHLFSSSSSTISASTTSSSSDEEVAPAASS